MLHETINNSLTFKALPKLLDVKTTLAMFCFVVQIIIEAAA